LLGKYDGRQFSSDIKGHLEWFLQVPLFEASNLWFVRPLVGFSILVGAVVLAALCLDCFPGGSASRGQAAARLAGVLGKIAVLSAMIPMTYAISLASYMPSAEYRTYTALEGAIVLLVLISLSRILSAPRWAPPRLAAIAIAAVAVCGNGAGFR
jgi:hypothetical protein